MLANAKQHGGMGMAEASAWGQSSMESGQAGDRVNFESGVGSPGLCLQVDEDAAWTLDPAIISCVLPADPRGLEGARVENEGTVGRSATSTRGGTPSSRRRVEI